MDSFLVLAMCQLLLSGVGYVPTPNVHLDVWERVESYTIYMLLACRLKITFTFSLELILSVLVQLQHLLLPSLIVTSSWVRVGTPLPLWLRCISGLGPEGLQAYFIVSLWTFHKFQLWLVVQVGDTVVALRNQRLLTKECNWPVLVKKFLTLPACCTSTNSNIALYRGAQ